MTVDLEGAVVVLNDVGPRAQRQVRVGDLAVLVNPGHDTEIAAMNADTLLAIGICHLLLTFASNEDFGGLLGPADRRNDGQTEPVYNKLANKRQLLAIKARSTRLSELRGVDRGHAGEPHESGLLGRGVGALLRAGGGRGRGDVGGLVRALGGVGDLPGEKRVEAGHGLTDLLPVLEALGLDGGVRVREQANQVARQVMLTADLDLLDDRSDERSARAPHLLGRVGPPAVRAGLAVEDDGGHVLEQADAVHGLRGQIRELEVDAQLEDGGLRLGLRGHGLRPVGVRDADEAVTDLEGTDHLIMIAEQGVDPVRELEAVERRHEALGVDGNPYQSAAVVAVESGESAIFQLGP